ncbi:MAG: Fe-S cluster assembly protein SufB [Firmicutes bacterium]|nr:Fe-S cluster assembly protein SufB [Bacillota bacterium]
MNNELNEEFVKMLSKRKNEPKWMTEFRVLAYHKFCELENPSFGPTLKIDFNQIKYYKGNFKAPSCDWQSVHKTARDTFKDLGVIDAEKKYLDGVTNQYESEVVYHSSSNENIIFTSTDEALQKYPELFQKYFNNLVKYDENKYTALNSALWSGGSFIYIPPHTKVDRPLQSYFRIDTKNLGQFERTIIIVDHDSELHYIEGCTAKNYSTTSLHAGVVEIYVGKNSKCKYSTIQNWSKDVYNLVTKRAVVEENGYMEWIDGNVGSGVTMKYPSCILKGDNSVGNSISIAFAKNGQYLDAGAKMIHLGKNTRSNILSKSISEDGGISNYRGTVKIAKNATNSYAKVKCDTIILDDHSKSNTYPKNIVLNNSSTLEHEATISKINEEKLFYLMSKGLSEKAAKDLFVLGFISDFKKSLPMEYAVELNRLLKE